MSDAINDAQKDSEFFKKQRNVDVKKSELIEYLSEKLSEDGHCAGKRDEKYFQNCNENDSECCLDCWEKYLTKELKGG